MSRVVYIGGFGNGQKTADKVGEAFSKYYEEVEPYTFSFANQHRYEIARRVKGAELATISSGAIPPTEAHARPDHFRVFSGLLPDTRTHLFVMTGVKTWRMHRMGQGIHNEEDKSAVRSYELDSLKEFAKHPTRNFGPFLSGKIPHFNTVSRAFEARDSGIPVSLTYHDDDVYFDLSEGNEGILRNAGVEVVRMPGEHDELVLRPEQTLATYFASVKS